jgi:GNAT superfamily N-acetyltransferase
MGAEGNRVASRMQRGCRCFGAWIGTDLVGFGWVSTAAEWIGELHLEIRPARGEAYIWNCVTLPGHRRKGVFSAVLRAITAQLKVDGLGRAWIGSLSDPAESAFPKAGFVPVLRFDVTSPAGLRWLRILPAYKVDPLLSAAGSNVIGSRGIPFGAGFYLSTSESKRH